MAPPPNRAPTRMRSTRSSARSRIAEYGGLAPGRRAARRAVRLRPRPDGALQLLAGRRLRGRATTGRSTTTATSSASRPTSGRSWATLGVVAVATVLTLAVAFPFAYWLDALRVPALAQAVAARARDPARSGRATCCASTRGSTILGQNGAINRFLQRTGLTDAAGLVPPLRPAGGDPRARLPLLPVRRADALRALERFDWNQFKAAMDLGATAGTALGAILLPQIRPGHHDGGHLRLHPDPRRVPDAAARRRHEGRDDRQPDRRTSSTRAQYTRGAAAALLIAAF